MSHKIFVSAPGSATAPYDTVAFSITVSAPGATGGKARALQHDAAAEVISYVDVLIASKVAHSKVVSLVVDPAHKLDNHRQVFDGYLASTKVSFSSDKVGDALAIQERLTTFEFSKVESVVYGFKDFESLREQAIEDAWRLVARRFGHTARTVWMDGGIRADDYEPVSWEVTENHRSISKVAAPSEDGTPGMAKVSVVLNVTIGKKRRK